MLPETTRYMQENSFFFICDCIRGVYPSIQQVAYPDVGPVMLLSESSVKDLSSKLEKDVTVERFRPNIVVSDCEAFDEVCCNLFFLLIPPFGY